MLPTIIIGTICAFTVAACIVVGLCAKAPNVPLEGDETLLTLRHRTVNDLARHREGREYRIKKALELCGYEQDDYDAWQAVDEFFTWPAGEDREAMERLRVWLPDMRERA